MKRLPNSTQAGFTLVELVVVILILGILAATALPRFMNVNTQAHQAAVSGAGGGFSAGVALARAQWFANGAGTTTAFVINVAGFGDDTTDVNATGWPTGTTGTAAPNTLSTNAQCVEVWNGIMQNPPTVSATVTTTDYTSSVSGATCTYAYNKDGSGTRSIAYNSTTGAVTITNP